MNIVDWIFISAGDVVANWSGVFLIDKAGRILGYSHLVGTLHQTATCLVLLSQAFTNNLRNLHTGNTSLEWGMVVSPLSEAGFACPEQIEESKRNVITTEVWQGMSDNTYIGTHSGDAGSSLSHNLSAPIGR